MKISSPKGDSFPAPPDDKLFETLPFNQSQAQQARDRVPKWSSERPSPLHEAFNASKSAFSPVRTPNKHHRRPVAGASVWRTPRSPERRSGDKGSLEGGSPNHKCLYKCVKPDAEINRAFRFRN